MRLDFAEVDEDAHLKDTVEELKRKALEKSRIDLRKRVYSQIS